MLARTLPPASSKGLLRRRWPRFEVGGILTAQVPLLDLVVPVKDISVGGFGVQAPMRFAVGEIHEFTLTLEQHPPARIRARAAYCYARRDREHMFMTGWEALGDPETARAMAGLVDRFLALRGDDPGAAPGAAAVPAGTRRA